MLTLVLPPSTIMNEHLLTVCNAGLFSFVTVVDTAILVQTTKTKPFVILSIEHISIDYCSVLAFTLFPSILWLDLWLPLKLILRFPSFPLSAILSLHLYLCSFKAQCSFCHAIVCPLNIYHLNISAVK